MMRTDLNEASCILRYNGIMSKIWLETDPGN
jgi:hypothetical protein